jgi:Fe-S-cluster containining protein
VSARADRDAAAARERDVERLGVNRDAAACSAAARGVLDALETEYEAHAADGAAIACAPRCSFCCHLRVGVFAHEAIALLEHVRTALPAAEAAALEQRIVANARLIDGLTPAEHYARRLACAFLVDGLCAVHSARPSSCARYHSMSRARCEQAFANPRDMGTPRNSRPVLLELQKAGNALDGATCAGLERGGLHATKAELHLLLAALIEDPALVERWRAGEDVALAVGDVSGERGPPR